MSEDTATNPAEGEELSPEAEVEATEGQGEVEAPELDDEGNPIEPESEVDDDTEEFEHDGQKYALPKALKGAVMMQADYTKKTQALAEQGRQVEETRKQLDERLKAAGEAEDAIIDARATVKAIDGQIGQLKAEIAEVEKELANVDWRALSQMEGGEVLYRQREQYLRQLRLAQDKLAEDRTSKANDLDAKVKARDEAVSARTLEMQQAAAKQIEDRDAALKAKFPKWAEEYPQIQAFVSKTWGIPAEDIQRTPNPALLEMARYAKLGLEAEQRDRAAKTAAARVAPATSGAKPVTKVAGASTPRTDMNRLDTAAWMAARNKQVAGKGGR